MNKAIRPKKYVIALYILIPLVIYSFSVFVPIVCALFYSFFKWTGGPQKTFIGFENYITLASDKEFWNAFGHNIYLVILCIIGQIGIALIFLVLMSSRMAKFKGLHRTLGFFPSTISAIAIGFIWEMIYSYRYGILNFVLKSFGKDPIQWLNIQNTWIIMLVASIPLIWQYIGYYMVIFVSAISAIDTEVLEGAEIDGANAWQKAIYITFPLIKNTVLVCITLCISGNMKVFDHIYQMTMGGPGTATEVMALYGYRTSFNLHNMGYGSAISIGILILSLLCIFGSRFLIDIFTKEKTKGGDM